ncbi:MAG: hypothetical protein ACKO0Y_03925, partial [Bacteroidota bacterium]
ILERREQQTQEWFELALHRELIIWAEQQQSWNTAKQQILQTIHNNKLVPSIAARSLIKTLFKQ